MKLPYSKHSISKADKDAVTMAMASSHLTRGPLVQAFEEAVAEYVGARYAVACSSGTAALWLAYKAIGREVLSTTTNTCAATIMPLLEQGGEFHLYDIDPITWQSAKVNVPVHLMGHPIRRWPMAGWVVEDAAHALGASWLDGDMVGSCSNSKVTCFSFHPSKTITTGEGGMATTNSEELASKMRALKDYGRFSKNTHSTVGLNFHMSDMQAALGLSQLARIYSFLERRISLASRYFNRLESLPITLPKWDDGSSWHLFLVRVPQAQRKQVGEAFEDAGIQNQVLYRCMHTQPFMKGIKNLWPCPEAEAYEKECLALPLYPKLTLKEQDYVIETLEKALDG